MRTRFFAGGRVYNAVLGEFMGRSRAVKSDPAWQVARELPRRTPKERALRSAAFRAVEQAHGFAADGAQSYASSLRKAWVREHLPAQETQNLGARAFDAIRTGLGLAIVASIVDAHRGSVSMESREGATVFRVRLPVVDRVA